MRAENSRAKKQLNDDDFDALFGDDSDEDGLILAGGIEIASDDEEEETEEEAAMCVAADNARDAEVLHESVMAHPYQLSI